MNKNRFFKALILTMIVGIILSLCGCKSKEAQAVDDLIATIGEVTKDSEQTIINAETHYANLSDEEKKSLDNESDLKNARLIYDTLIADEVALAISCMDESVLNDGQQLKKIREQYDCLTDSQKSLVTNYKVLSDWENAYDNQQIEEVEELIRAINLSDIAYKDTVIENQIIVAEEAYQALDNRLKERVENYKDLSDARNTFDALAPIQLGSYRLEKDIIGQPTISIQAKNLSDRIVKSFSIFLFAYDEDGVPVKIYFNDYAKVLGYSSSLKPGESSKTNSYWQLYGEYSEMKQIVAFINDVEFYDGEIWKNPLLEELFMKYYEQLLDENDVMVLKQ